MISSVNEKEPTKSTVIGRPILLALEDVDGTPSFLEKALKFLEEHGSRVEGVLRQAADVDDVERRVREYEQGKVEFAPDEDAHVIACSSRIAIFSSTCILL
ncbi:rho GTPase-activating protein REN1-like [Trifolium medium]|uniref:Rho GTPase-activating protein REN1-like n=1 Tax=Trifolium medium TaxID=97028 RepID=A0A392N8D3_9FABA|nr:rho GTPase-activating protein REN1-like [Trifolium medium]